MSTPAPIRHGTPGGARTHYRRNERPCQACRAAANLAKPSRDPYRAVAPEIRGLARNGLLITPYVYGAPRPAWAPVLRIDYRRDMNKVPSAHVQVHGHRGALSHLLSQAGHATPHDMASLHIPVGGARFRPCLEDFIQFLIAECKFDPKTRQWRHHVEAGRARWRLRQAGAIARDLPEVSARELRALGYEVTEPSTPLPETSPKVLRSW